MPTYFAFDDARGRKGIGDLKVICFGVVNQFRDFRELGFDGVRT